jgi:2-iminobutanoate/2-iminopropanoate deaminase
MSKITKVEVEKAPRVIGPYSQGVIAQNFIFCSGQIALDPKSGEIVKGGIIEQTKQVIENLKAILIGAGADLSDVIKTEIYLVNISDFLLVNKIYSQYFISQPLPARVTVEVSKLPKDSLVEISCIAYKK